MMPQNLQEPFVIDVPQRSVRLVFREKSQVGQKLSESNVLRQLAQLAQ
jgi:hypothetical protein